MVSADADSDADVSASADAAAATVTQVVDCSSGAAEATTTASSASGENLQTFTGDLGGLPPAVTEGGRGFAVEGNDDFLNLDAALSRSCAVHKNQCADEANSGGDFDVAGEFESGHFSIFFRSSTWTPIAQSAMRKSLTVSPKSKGRHHSRRILACKRTWMDLSNTFLQR